MSGERIPGVALGIHFRSADVAARTLGVTLADWALSRYFQPTGYRR